MSSPFTFTFEMPLPPRPQQLQLQPSQFLFRQATPERHDDPMMEFIDYGQAAAVASLEHLLNMPTSPVHFSSPEEDPDNHLLLNNITTTHTIPTTTQNVNLSNSHAYHRLQRVHLLSNFDISNNSRTPIKVLDTRQESYYPGLELPSHYEKNLDSLYLNHEGLLMDYSENTDEFDLREFLKDDATLKVDYTAIPSSEETLLPISVQAYGNPALATAIPKESAAVVNLIVNECCSEDEEEDESDSESECDSDDDEITAASPMIIHVPPTPSPSPPRACQQQPQPQGIPSQVPEKTKIPRSRAKKGEKRVHACPDCNREFTRACNLQSHILTHLNLKPYACSECDKTFARVYDMQRHKRIHSNKAEDKPYDCPDCTIRFKRTEPRNRHRQFVHGWVPPPVHKH